MTGLLILRRNSNYLAQLSPATLGPTICVSGFGVLSGTGSPKPKTQISGGWQRQKANLSKHRLGGLKVGDFNVFVFFQGAVLSSNHGISCECGKQRRSFPLTTLQAHLARPHCPRQSPPPSPPFLGILVFSLFCVVFSRSSGLRSYRASQKKRPK